jgi:two-component system, response regulator PdtaR
MQDAEFPETTRWAAPRSGDEDGNSEPQNTVAAGQDNARTILIVEDDFLIAMETEAALSAAGFRVLEIAATAEEALKLATLYKPALVLMDIRLAGRRDGIDAAGDLFRELGMRCLFATAHDDERTRARAEPFSPLGWLTKPYTIPSLLGMVRSLLIKPQ